MEAKLLESPKIQNENLQLGLKIFQKIIVWICCNLIFPLLLGLRSAPSFKMAKFQLDDYFWKLLKSHQIISKKSTNYISRPLWKVYFEVYVGCHFPIVPQLIPHSMLMTSPLNQFTQTKPNWNKKPLTLTEGLSEELNAQLLSDAIFPSLLSQFKLPCFLIAHL